MGINRDTVGALSPYPAPHVTDLHRRWLIIAPEPVFLLPASVFLPLRLFFFSDRLSHSALPGAFVLRLPVYLFARRDVEQSRHVRVWEQISLPLRRLQCV